MLKAQGAPPDQVILEILFGKLLSRTLSAVAEIRVADHIDQAPIAVADLASPLASLRQRWLREGKCRI